MFESGYNRNVMMINSRKMMTQDLAGLKTQNFCDLVEKEDGRRLIIVL